MTPGLVPFIGIAALLTITPGPDMAIVTRTALQHGRRAAAWASLGICSGLLVWAAASAIGVAALLATSSAAYRTLRLLGAAYLVWLGLQSLRSARRGAPVEPSTDPVVEAQRDRTAFRRGLVNNLLNPKIAVFYTTFLPQFVAPGQPVLATSLLLATIHLAMGVVWLTAYAWAVTRVSATMRSDRVRRSLEGLTGMVLVGFGLRLAAERR